MSPLSQQRSVFTVLFAGSADFALQVPSECGWAQTRFVPVKEGWDGAIEEIANSLPDVCVFFNPEFLTSAQLQRLPGLKVGVLTREYDPDRLRRLARLTVEGGFRWFTSPEPATRARQVLPVLQTLPPLVDTARLPSSPDFGLHTAVMLGSRDSNEPNLKGIERLREAEDSLAMLEALKQSGVVFCSADASEYAQLLALALGQLVVWDRELPPHWGFEREDEYLIRPSEDWMKTLAEVERAPSRFRPVRIRAWQKVREMFDASAVMHRLVCDARWLAVPSSAGREDILKRCS
jgi:hypothetical protein